MIITFFISNKDKPISFKTNLIRGLSASMVLADLTFITFDYTLNHEVEYIIKNDKLFKLNHNPEYIGTITNMEITDNWTRLNN